MAYGDELLKTAPEATIREAIGHWTKIREGAKAHRDTKTMQVAGRMLDKYEGELARRETLGAASNEQKGRRT
ncbi:MAG: hypothetical protein IJ089_03870 [Clostridia bacterium]|nr:hypothetical protein [Clostridia bacterium]